MTIIKESSSNFSVELKIEFPICPNLDNYRESFLGDSDSFTPRKVELNFEKPNVDSYDDILADFDIEGLHFTEIMIDTGTVDDDGEGQVTAYATLAAPQPFELDKDDLDYLKEGIANGLAEDECIFIHAEGYASGVTPEGGATWDAVVERSWEDDDYEEDTPAKVDAYSKSPITIEIVKKPATESKNVNEASYGGAFDIEDSQYFTRDDINEFAYQVVDALNEHKGINAQLSEVYIEQGNTLEMTIFYNDEEFTCTEHIDMRKIRKPSDLFKAYGSEFEERLYGDIQYSEGYGNASIPDEVYESKEQTKLSEGGGTKMPYIFQNEKRRLSHIHGKIKAIISDIEDYYDLIVKVNGSFDYEPLVELRDNIESVLQPSAYQESKQVVNESEFKKGDRVRQTWANPYNVGTIKDVRKTPEGVSYRVLWDYSDGPEDEWLPAGEPLSPYNDDEVVETNESKKPVREATNLSKQELDEIKQNIEWTKQNPDAWQDDRFVDSWEYEGQKYYIIDYSNATDIRGDVPQHAFLCVDDDYRYYDVYVSLTPDDGDAENGPGSGWTYDEVVRVEPARVRLTEATTEEDIKENSDFYSLRECINDYINSGEAGDVAIYGGEFGNEQLYKGPIDSVIDDDALDADGMMVLDAFYDYEIDEDDELYTPDVSIVITVA